MINEKKDQPAEGNAPGSLHSAVTQCIIEAIQCIRYGAVEIVIHDGNVVQIERREKIRVES